MSFFKGERMLEALTFSKKNHPHNTTATAWFCFSLGRRASKRDLKKVSVQTHLN